MFVSCLFVFFFWIALLIVRPPLSSSAKFIESGDWNLEDVTIKAADQTYECCRHPFSDVTYKLKFHRKSLYHVVYQILPCVVIILLTVLNFIIPPESGERISFCITILLAMSVYLLILADSLPETSDDFAILGVYYMATIFLIAFSLVSTVVVLRCHFAEKKPPEGLMKFAKFVLRRKENISGNNTVCVQASDNPSMSGEEGIEITDIEEKPKDNTFRDPVLALIAQSIKEQKEQSEWKDSWKEIAEATDRFLLIIFVVITIVATLAIWFQQP